MKRIVALLLCLTFLCCLAACGTGVKIAPNPVAKVTYETFDNGLVSFQKPKGWTVEIGPGESYTNYAVKAYDPAAPDTMFFFCLKLEGFMKTEKARATWAYYYPSQTYAHLAAIDPQTTEAFYAVWEQNGAYANEAYKTTFFPVIKNFSLIETLGANLLGGDVVRASFENAEGKAMQGLFTAAVTDVGSYYVTENWNPLSAKVDVAPLNVYHVVMMTAPDDALADWAPHLDHCLSTLAFSEEFMKGFNSQEAAMVSTVKANAAIYDSMSDSIMDSWEKRSASYDVISQKRSDATLGYERVYDVETGDVYRAYNGFTDEYQGERYQPVTDDMYTKTVEGYIEKYSREGEIAMKQESRRLGCLILCFVMLLFTGCVDFADLADLTYTLPEDVGPLWVAYSSPEEKNNLIFQSVEELDGYRSVYHEYSTDMYYSSLSEEDQLLYRLLEYGFDHCATRILFDLRLGDDLTEQLPRVMTCLSLDSPLVEQNLTQRYYTVTENQVSDFGPLSVERSVQGILVRVNSFSQSAMDLKLEAVEKARAVVAALPEGLTDEERGRELYRYLRENVTYTTYANSTQASYLYDALVTGTTHCDGFANAFSLLCNMAGVPCFEKIHFATEEENSGHTWDCIRLNGVWYNADAALASDDVDEVERATGCFFWYGFSDEYQTRSTYLDEVLPACPKNLREVDFAATSTDGLARKIALALRTAKEGYVYFALSGVPAGPDVFQEVCNVLRVKIVWVLLSSTAPYRYIVRITN
ncbi:MAG: transglutaminase domain-containing protein [Clostridia bacterium]|nr:transglutaminase domain-containing protein [Clostridia bacterium]